MMLGGDTLSPKKHVINTTFGHTFPVVRFSSPEMEILS
jgi:hypothetical protein